MCRNNGKMQAKGADIEIDLREGWYHLFTGNYEPEIEKRSQYLIPFKANILRRCC